MANEILRMEHITKIYPGVKALDDVTLGFEEGEVHAIAGENGAGKSTFIKIITGAIRATEGQVIFNGKTIENNDPEKAIGLGIGAIYQEFNLIPTLSVAENIFYGRYPKKNGLVDKKTMISEADKVLKDLGLQLDPRSPVRSLSVGYQQLVEIAKAVSRDVRLLIMDEPSAPLTENEVHHLFEIIKKLKEKKVTIIYISHRLEEIFSVCERVSVFRDGKYIKTMRVEETNVPELIRAMVNRELGQSYPPKDYQKGEKVLEIRNLTTSLLKNVSLEAYRGEILGLAGLVGAGRTETVRALFGADKRQSGDFYINGRQVKIRSPKDAIRCGIGLIPEDRKAQGLLLKMPIRYNVSFANLKAITGSLGISMAKDNNAAVKYIDLLKIKTPGAEELAGQLSGGNQQKVVLAKWLFKDSDILIFDEPTRGIDVGAKTEIYKLLIDLVSQGKVIIIISSDMPELLGMADRIVVMHEGEVMGSLEKEEFSQERILTLASGIKSDMEAVS